MAIVFCSNCGAEIEAAARFCKRCGQPSSLLEATTRSLEPPAPPEAATRPVQPFTTAPTEPAPHERWPAPAPPTNSLAPEGQKRTVIILAGLVVFLLAALAALGLLTFMISSGNAPTPPPVVIVPEAPEPPELPEPPEPPEPPPPPVIDGETAISDELIYPDAEVTMEITRAEGSSTVELRTSDAPDKVIAWYVARLKPTEQVKIPGRDTILEADGVSVVIRGREGETRILINQEPGRK